MSSLFIVGNGFDMAHGFKTGFDSFKEWIRTEYSVDDTEEIFEIPEFQTNYKGLDQYDNQNMAFFFYNVIYNILGDNWNDFESALSQLDWGAAIEVSVEDLKWAGHFEPRDLMFIAEDFAVQLRDMAFILTEDLFRSWAHQIDITSPDKLANKLKSIIETDNCYFLNFNYTDTLELYYGVENVCHIHGRASNYDELIVGHEGQYKWPSEEEYNRNFYMTGTYSYIDAISEQFKKDTKRAFLKNFSFFNSLTNVTDIYFHGFSFSAVDIYYLDMIFQYIDPRKTIFHLHSYRKKDWKTFKTKLVELGAQADNIVPFRFEELSDTE